MWVVADGHLDFWTRVGVNSKCLCRLPFFLPPRVRSHQARPRVSRNAPVFRRDVSSSGGGFVLTGLYNLLEIPCSIQVSVLAAGRPWHSGLFPLPFPFPCKGFPQRSAILHRCHRPPRSARLQVRLLLITTAAATSTLYHQFPLLPTLSFFPPSNPTAGFAHLVPSQPNS